MTDSHGCTSTDTRSIIVGNLLPSLQIYTPITGASYYSNSMPTFHVKVFDYNGTGEANRGISRVDYYYRSYGSPPDIFLASVTSAPFEYTCTGTLPGMCSFSAIAYDGDGAQASTSVSMPIWVYPYPNNPPPPAYTYPANIAPTVRFVSPCAANGTASYTTNNATVELQAEAVDMDGSIANVQFYEGATLLGSVTTAPFIYQWTSVPLGSHTVTVKAFDNNSASSTTSTITVNVSNPAPGVTLLIPQDNSMVLCSPAFIILTAQAWDSNGSVTALDFYVNGVKTAGTQRSGLLWTLEKNNLGPGNYAIQAEATDNEGVKTISSSYYFSVIQLSILDPEPSETIGGRDAIFRLQVVHKRNNLSQEIIDPNNLSINGVEQRTDGTPQQVSIQNFLHESRTQDGNGVITDIYRVTVDTRMADGDEVLVRPTMESGISITPMYNNPYSFTANYLLSSGESIFSSSQEDTVKNLWITSTSFEHCFFLRAQDDTNPTAITVNFDHYLAAASYTVEVTIRQTLANTTIISTQTVTTTSHSATVNWTPNPDDYPWGGYFCYDAKVTYGDNESARLCSTACTVTSDSTSVENEITAKFLYCLSQVPKSGSVMVNFYEDLEPLGQVSNISDQSRDSTNPVTMTFNDPIGSCRAIISGKDNNIDNCARQEKPILPANSGVGYVLYRCLKFVLNNDPSGSELVGVYKRWDLFANSGHGAWMTLPQAEPGWTFPANSGRSIKGPWELDYYDLNSNGIQDTGEPVLIPLYYLNNGSIAAQRDETVDSTICNAGFGSTPTHDSCVQNGSRPWQLLWASNMGTTFDRDRASCWDDYVWRSNMSSSVLIESDLMPGTYKLCYPLYFTNLAQLCNYRFKILNYAQGDQGDSHTIRFTGKADVTRTKFRVHEDTNYLLAGGSHEFAIAGTEGCIGLNPGCMQYLYPKLAAMRAAASPWLNTYTHNETDFLPLYVFPYTGGNITEWAYRKVVQ